MKAETVLCGTERIDYLVRLHRVCGQNTVDGDGCSLVDDGLGDPLDVGCLTQEVENRVARHMLGHRGQKRHRLDDTDRMALGGLHWAHESPARAVKLAWRKQLT